MLKIPSANKHAIKIQDMLNIYESIQSNKQRFKNQVESTSKEHKDLLRTLNRLIDNLDAEAQKLFNKIELLLLFVSYSITLELKHFMKVLQPGLKQKNWLLLLL